MLRQTTAPLTIAERGELIPDTALTLAHANIRIESLAACLESIQRRLWVVRDSLPPSDTREEIGTLYQICKLELSLLEG